MKSSSLEVSAGFDGLAIAHGVLACVRGVVGEGGTARVGGAITAVLDHLLDRREAVVLAMDGREEVHAVVSDVDDVNKRDDPFEDGSLVALTVMSTKSDESYGCQ